MSSSLQNLHFDQSQWKCFRHFNRSFPTHERALWPPSVPFFLMQICFQQKLQSSKKFFLVPASHQQSSTKFFLVPASLLQFLLNGQRTSPGAFFIANFQFFHSSSCKSLRYQNVSPPWRYHRRFRYPIGRPPCPLFARILHYCQKKKTSS